MAVTAIVLMSLQKLAGKKRMDDQIMDAQDIIDDAIINENIMNIERSKFRTNPNQKKKAIRR